jgi:hypothetical protein
MTHQDHVRLIQAATKWHAVRGRSCGDDPDSHDWTSTGEGGCDSNPGVWATGGTSFHFASHCKACGLHRDEYVVGRQRNPGEHDETVYDMPETWCANCECEYCECDL